MKVLFAIGDAVTSENIVKQYYALYGEKIEYKNVFYFKALLEEVKKDKTYDRIVIAEQLEPPQRNVVDAIDQMIFNNIDSITDELEDSTIIFICSDGRTKNDLLIARLFNIGIYNLLMGDERNIVPLCGLIKDPRNKKEAKEYLKTNPAIGEAITISKSDDQVEEVELINISKYFSNLKNPEEYLREFARVEEQYNEKQLQIIVTALYQNLKRGKEIYETLNGDSRYSKYCIISNYSPSSSPIQKNKSAPSTIGGILGFLAGKKMKANEENNKNDAISKNREKEAESMAEKASEEAKDMMEKSQQEAREQAEKLKKESEERRKAEKELKAQQEAQLKAQQEAQLKAQQEAQLKAQQEAQLKAQQEAQLRAQQEAQLKAQQEAQLRAQQEAQLRAQQEAQLRAQQEAQLRAQQEAQLRAEQERLQAEKEALRLKQEELKKQQELQNSNVYNSQDYNGFNTTPQQNNFQPTSYPNENINNIPYEANSTPQLIVPADYKKVVAFVGTNKVGTSFIANSIGSLMAMKGVKTSLLDMTKNRGLYWFYNEATYRKRDLVTNCMTNLSNNMATPIQVGKYKDLTLYTTIPNGKEENRKAYKHRNVVETAKKNCNLLIIDCDFSTPYEYFEQASEVYIVQDLDLIKAQETKEFFRELKTRGMDWNKLRIVINNSVKCKVTAKKIIKNALTYYNDSSMTFTEEFDEIKKFVEVPMNPINYSNYLESMEDGKLNYEKYTPELKEALEQLSIMVYGMTSKNKKRGLFG